MVNIRNVRHYMTQNCHEKCSVILRLTWRQPLKNVYGTEGQTFSESLWREWCLNEFVPWVGRESAGEW